MHQTLGKFDQNRFDSARGNSKFSFPCRIHHTGYRIKVEGKAFIYLLILLVVIEMASD